MKVKFLINFILFLLIFNNVEAGLEEKLNQSWRWTTYTSDNSDLPSSFIYSVVESEDGTIWANTLEGIAWFDGYIWHTVKELSGNRAEAIILKKYKNSSVLLNNLTSKELWQLSPTKAEKLELDFEGKRLLVESAIKYKDESILFCAKKADEKTFGLYVYKNKITAEFPTPIKNFKSCNLWLNKTGEIWFLTDLGLFRLIENRWRIETFGQSGIDFFLTRPVADSKGNGVFSITNPVQMRGNWYYSKDKKPKLNYDNNNILTKTIDFNKSDECLASLNGLALSIFSNGISREMEQVPDQLMNITDYFFSQENNLVVASSIGIHICRLLPELWIYKSYKSYSSHCVNDIIISQKGDLWAATNYGVTIYHKDGKIENITSALGKKLGIVTGINEDSNGNIWISSGSYFLGTFKYDGSSWRHYDRNNSLIGGYIHKIKKDRGGRLWFLSFSEDSFVDDNVIYILENNLFKKWKHTKEFAKTRIYNFLDAEDGAKWVATNKGVKRLKDGTWTSWYNDPFFANNGCFAMTEKDDGTIWMTNRVSGIAYIYENSLNQVVAIDSFGMVSSWDLAFDNKERLWITSNQGLFILNNNNVSVIDKSQGLTSNSIWPILIKDNKVYTGASSGGVNILNLNELKPKRVKIKINNLAINNDEAFLSWKTYSYLGQVSEQMSFVRYRIDQKNWSKWTLKKSKTFFNLEPGDHSFEIQSKNILGETNSKPIKIKFKIPYPVMLSTEYIVTFILLLVTIIFVLVLNNINNRRKKANEIIELQNREISESHSKLESQNIEVEKKNSELQELNDTKDKFFSIIAHDLINPFNSLLGNTKYLLNSYDNILESERIDCVEDIYTSSDNLYNLLDNLLQWAKSQQNKIQFLPKKIDLHEVAALTATIYKMNCQSKDITINNYIHSGSLVLADFEMVSTIFRNLISNAIKFSHNGSKIDILSIKQNGHYEISIKDYGVGIAPENIKNIFMLNKHISTAGTNHEKGTGLGLILTKEFVEKSGGQIEVISQVNQGTEFKFSLAMFKE